jgi:hypothetical protein
MQEPFFIESHLRTDVTSSSVVAIVGTEQHEMHPRPWGRLLGARLAVGNGDAIAVQLCQVAFFTSAEKQPAGPGLYKAHYLF